MSKRAKFMLITWIGESIAGLQRAKISTDKAIVKEVVQVGVPGSVQRGDAVMVPVGEPDPVSLIPKE